MEINYRNNKKNMKNNLNKKDRLTGNVCSNLQWG